MADLNIAYQSLMESAAMNVVYETRGGRTSSAAVSPFLNASVPHEWFGAELTVERQYEGIVDRIMARTS